jgi:hypothetical protein
MHTTRKIAIAATLTATVALTACATVTGPVAAPMPLMGWDARPEAAIWTPRTIAAIAAEDAVLAARVPADIDAFCPGYEKNSLDERRAFWAGVLSAVAKHESSWNPAASGGGGRYIGIMQISPTTAAHHGCSATTASGLKDGAANLECAVEIMANAVQSDGVVAGSGNRGVGRDWMPLRNGGKRAEIAGWTRSQDYCEG